MLGMVRLAACMIVATIIAIASPTRADEGAEPRVLTSIFPPYSYEENFDVKGSAVAVARELLISQGLPNQVEIYPWARAYHLAQKTPNSLFFSIARTPERESMFHWIGEIMDFDVHIYRRADRGDIVLKSPADFADHSFAALRSDIKTTFIKKTAKDITEVALESSAIKMVHAGRVDLVASDKTAMEHRVEQLGFQQDDFVSAYRISSLSKPLYLVANKGVDPALVLKLQNGLKDINRKNSALPKP